LVPDTGSADLWVPAAGCLTCLSKKYDAASSCTSKLVGDHVSFKYGDGTRASGIAMTDKVLVGDLAIQNQLFIQVNSMTEQSFMQFGGILGLAHHRIGYALDDPGEHTFIWSLFSEHPKLPRQFSFFFSDTQTPSQIIFGEPDISRHAKEATRFSKSGNAKGVNTWTATMWSIGFSGSGWVIDFPEQGAAGVGALVDSGTSLIVLAPDIYDDINAEIRKHLSGCVDNGGTLSCDCPAHVLAEKRGASIPALGIAFVDDAGDLFPVCLAPEEWIVKPANVLGIGACTTIFQKGDPKQPTPVILGMSFMRSFYTTFDVTGQRVGFARSINSPASAGMSCHIGFSVWRFINFDWIFFVCAFVLAMLCGWLCGYCLIPADGPCCGDEPEDEEASAELLRAQKSPSRSSEASDVAEEAEAGSSCTIS